jgi:hypothetical protein
MNQTDHRKEESYIFLCNLAAAAREICSDKVAETNEVKQIPIEESLLQKMSMAATSPFVSCYEASLSQFISFLIDVFSKEDSVNALQQSTEL